jgi:hypothetical protein
MSRLSYYLLRMFISSGYILLAMNLSAQHNITLRGDTLILNNQAKFWINEELFFGSGTMPDKTYSYIYEAPNSLQKLIKNRNRKLLSRGFKGYKSKVVKFEKEIGHNRKEYDYNIIVLEMPEGKRYWCDIVNAFSNHEILLKTIETNTAEVTKVVENENPVDVSAELARLKKLLDSKAISQREYDLRKKKLLDSQKPVSASKHSKTSKPKPKPVIVF